MGVLLDPELGAIQPAGSALGDTVEALSIAPGRGCCASAEAVRVRWELAVWLTDGSVHGQRRDPP